MDFKIVKELEGLITNGKIDEEKLKSFIKEMIHGGKIDPYKTLDIKTKENQKLEDAFIKEKYKKVEEAYKEYEQKKVSKLSKEDLLMTKIMQEVIKICYDEIKDEESRKALKEKREECKGKGLSAERIERNEHPHFRSVEFEDPKRLNYIEVSTDPDKVNKNKSNNIVLFPGNNRKGGNHYTEER